MSRRSAEQAQSIEAARWAEKQRVIEFKPWTKKSKPKKEPKNMSIPKIKITPAESAAQMEVLYGIPARPAAPPKPAAQMEVLYGFPARPAAPPKPAAPAVTWDDVCGQVAAKAAMREAIELPVKFADVYKRFGRCPSKGVLLYGPPGNGKTLLAKAAANAIASLYGDQPTRARGFISVKGPELFDMYVGETERKIRNLFAEAKQHKREVGFPSIIFIDEAEAILSARGTNGRASYMDGFVQQFLTEMDGFDDSSAIVILATNRPDVLDPAIVRDGRIDRRIHVGPPTRDDAEAIFRKVLRGRPLDGADGLNHIAARATAALFDPRHVLYRVHLAENAGTKNIALHNVTSCAQVVGIVERATSRAIARVIAGGAEGIAVADLVAEVESTLEESRALSHMDSILDFCHGLKWTVVERVRADDLASPVPVMKMPVSTTGAN